VNGFPKRDVEDELRWDPDIDATDIGIAVKNGVVTLTGFVRSYTQKYDRRRVELPEGARRGRGAPRQGRQGDHQLRHDQAQGRSHRR
jgi:hypothetical protein